MRWTDDGLSAAVACSPWACVNNYQLKYSESKYDASYVSLPPPCTISYFVMRLSSGPQYICTVCVLNAVTNQSSSVTNLSTNEKLSQIVTRLWANERL